MCMPSVCVGSLQCSCQTLGSIHVWHVVALASLSLTLMYRSKVLTYTPHLLLMNTPLSCKCYTCKRMSVCLPACLSMSQFLQVWTMWSL